DKFIFQRRLDGDFFFLICLSSRSSFFNSSFSACNKRFFASNRSIFSSGVRSRSIERPELVFRVSCKPSTPLFRQAARQRFPEDLTRFIPIKSASKPASSKISRGSLPFSFS